MYCVKLAVVFACEFLLLHRQHSQVSPTEAGHSRASIRFCLVLMFFFVAVLPVMLGIFNTSGQKEADEF